jgi:hypothetical protein
MKQTQPIKEKLLEVIFQQWNIDRTPGNAVALLEAVSYYDKRVEMKVINDHIHFYIHDAKETDNTFSFYIPCSETIIWNTMGIIDKKSILEAVTEELISEETELV